MGVNMDKEACMYQMWNAGVICSVLTLGHGIFGKQGKKKKKIGECYIMFKRELRRLSKLRCCAARLETVCGFRAAVCESFRLQQIQKVV